MGSAFLPATSRWSLRKPQLMQDPQSDLARAPLFIDVGFVAFPFLADGPKCHGDDFVKDLTHRLTGQKQIEHDGLAGLLVVSEQCRRQSLGTAFDPTCLSVIRGRHPQDSRLDDRMIMFAHESQSLLHRNPPMPTRCLHCRQ